MSLNVGTIVNGRITGITNFGAFVETEDGSKGMIHISEVSRSYIEDIKSVLKVGQAVTCKVISKTPEGRIALSLKQLEEGDDSKKEKKSAKKPKNAQNAGAKPAQSRPHKKYEPAPPVTSPGDFEWQGSPSGGSFEDMMSKFKRTSEDKMSDLKRGESRGYSRRGGRK